MHGESRLKIVQAGDRVLRRKARALTPDEILNHDTQDLIQWLRGTMRDAPGVGLAAPQVGVGLQIVVIEDREELHRSLSPQRLAERRRKPVAFHAIINPVITSTEGTAAHFEGCLSVPGWMGVVPRALKVRVECRNERAAPVTIEADGWYARILQHEIDHLNGILYVDRMLSRSLTTVENYNRHWADVSMDRLREELGL